MEDWKQYAKELLTYNPDTGVVRWKGGQIAGTKKADGSLSVVIRGKKLALHRVIFFLQGEELTTINRIQHRNGNKSDNRWENMLVVDQHFPVIWPTPSGEWCIVIGRTPYGFYKDRENAKKVLRIIAEDRNLDQI